MTFGSDHRSTSSSTGCTATSSFPSGLPAFQKSSMLLSVRGVLCSGTTHFLGETMFRTYQLPGSCVRRSRSRTLAAWNLVSPISNCCRKSRKRSETIRQAAAAKKSGRCFDLIGIPNELEKKKSLGSSFEPTGRHCRRRRIISPASGGSSTCSAVIGRRYGAGFERQSLVQIFTLSLIASCAYSPSAPTCSSHAHATSAIGLHRSKIPMAPRIGPRCVGFVRARTLPETALTFLGRPGCR